jgi:hypothetical protein
LSHVDKFIYLCYIYQLRFFPRRYVTNPFGRL